MSWASRRRFIIISIMVVGALGILGAFAYVTFHRAPTCFDNKQNQDEEGIDCGGTCAYQCTASEAAPSVRFARPVSPASGRTDLIAYIDNSNGDVAASNLNFTIELYSPTNTVIAKKEGRVDLPPASTVPVYVPNIYTGSQEVARAFITFDTPSHLWYRYRETRPIPEIADVRIDTSETPRVTAVAVNNSAAKITNVPFVITIFDAAGNAIAASRTIAPSIPAHGSAPLVFTWSTPFTGAVSRVDIKPVIPLPPAPPTI
ncbi:MAG: FxLYD domain-containing protein [Bacillota bacterium]